MPQPRIRKMSWPDPGEIRKFNSNSQLGLTSKYLAKLLDLPSDALIFVNPDGSRAARSDKTLGALRKHWTEKKMIPVDYHLAAETKRITAQLLKSIDKAKWRHAKPPQTEEYVVWYNYRDLYEAFQHLIRNYGYVGYYLSRRYKYFNVGGYKYWLVWPILNRELLSIGKEREEAVKKKTKGKLKK